MRQQGFYWVVYKGQQQVALYDSKAALWWMVGMLEAMRDSDLEQISDALLEPGIEVGHG